VNLIKNLLSRRHKTETVESASFVNWPGQSGKEYPYQVYSLDSSFKPIAANYIYAKESETGYWIPLYIAQTRNLNQRLEDSEKQGLAMQNGATHILVHISDQSQAARCSEEEDLILRWQPACNGPAES
jgi:hypothetical protein